jgi:L-threonine kinase
MGGAIADRMDRRLLLVLDNHGIAACSAALALGAFGRWNSGSTSTWCPRSARLGRDRPAGALGNDPQPGPAPASRQRQRAQHLGVHLTVIVSPAIGGGKSTAGLGSVVHLLLKRPLASRRCPVTQELADISGLDSVARAVVRIPATCGEVLQGVLDSGEPVLISLPVDVMGSVEVTLMASPDVRRVDPPLRRATAALHLALANVGWPGGAVVRLGGEVPQGRGMGSSTIDVAGVFAGVAAAATRRLTLAELVRFATTVEPSDSSPLPGLWAIDHVDGARATYLGPAPRGWHVVAVDSGTAVATADVHRRCGAGPLIDAADVAALHRAATNSDGAALAKIATLSAHRNQSRLPHPLFDTVRDVVTSTSALGMCIAHSGSLCAVICADTRTAHNATAALRARGIASTTWRVAAPGLSVEVGAQEARS